ncbi:hypothetical protein ZOSMA_151G00310 [Zostera marina]|uniref:Uncharacterized protein n=1 Tax=Zostera marina TaxID=29655 RepID=A0A0K9PVZ3_ZOSMR|nr:hypothetical protein ZOSMA_151G00310 [Zostera marina]
MCVSNCRHFCSKSPFFKSFSDLSWIFFLLDHAYRIHQPDYNIQASSSKNYNDCICWLKMEFYVNIKIIFKGRYLRRRPTRKDRSSVVLLLLKMLMSMMCRASARIAWPTQFTERSIIGTRMLAQEMNWTVRSGTLISMALGQVKALLTHSPSLLVWTRGMSRRPLTTREVNSGRSIL